MGVSTSDPWPLPEGGTEGQESDFERVLRQHRLSPEVCDPVAERIAAQEAAETAAATGGKDALRE